jgi:DNA invertase Pin-like site-specific DNA recombinase
MMIGYARVSTDEQKLDLQLRALEAVGCDTICTDQGRSGRSFDRAGLEAALQSLEPGGTLVVWRLDRLGRSLSGLVAFMDQLGKQGIDFRSLTENIDTSSSGGRLMFHMMAALAEFERSIISERTRAGLSAARARGRKLGRPQALTPIQVDWALQAARDTGMNSRDISAELGVSTRTLRRYLHIANGKEVILSGDA